MAADPTQLFFEYVQRIGHVIDQLLDGPITAVHLGAGVGQPLAFTVGRKWFLRRFTRCHSSFSKPISAAVSYR